ncbi:lactonase family protein [Belliella marina]|uniref:Lactonase family protein n=1 Tax=Belliella marina TaxID=1644146 RepID=A0ABW4VMW4_9BACT
MHRPIYKLFCFAALSLMTMACKKNQTEHVVEVNDHYRFLIGGYTEHETDGIGLLKFDPVSNDISVDIIGNGIKNPSFLLTNKDQTILFAVEETAGDQGGKVKSFELDLDQKSLKLLSTVDTEGNHPCHLAMDPSEKFLVVGNYSGGNFSVFKNEAGVLTQVQTIQHEGKSIVGSRQEKPHVHSTVFHPNGKQLLVADLGTDKIHLYDFNPDLTVPFQHAKPAYFEVEAGSGPRHLLLNESGDLIYLIHELSAELGVYSYENGVIHNLEVLPLTHPHFEGSVGAAEIKFSKDGKFVYASNRGDANEISVYEKDLNDRLILIQRTSTKGETPRNFDFSPDGNFLVVAHQGSDGIIVFEMDQKSGLIKEEVQKVAFKKPSYVLPIR